MIFGIRGNLSTLLSRTKASSSNGDPKRQKFCLAICGRKSLTSEDVGGALELSPSRSLLLHVAAAFSSSGIDSRSDSLTGSASKSREPFDSLKLLLFRACPTSQPATFSNAGAQSMSLVPGSNDSTPCSSSPVLPKRSFEFGGNR